MSGGKLLSGLGNWVPRWRKLTDDEKAACRGVVSEPDLDELVVIFTPLPKYWGASATTLWRWVLTDPGREGDDGWDELMAHEAVHVEQWRDRGILGFGVWYLDSYLRSRLAGKGHWQAYEEVPAEAQARERASKHFS